MPKLSADAVIEGIRRLAATDPKTEAASALEAYLVSKRLEVLGGVPTIARVNQVVAELFVVLPDHPKGRIRPFLAREEGEPFATPKWGNIHGSGRATVWNVTSRGARTEAASLFKDGDIRNGLFDDAPSRLARILVRAGGQPVQPSAQALKVFLLRNEDFPNGVTEAVLDQRLAVLLNITPADLAQFCAHQPLTARLDGSPPWDPALLPSELQPAAAVAAAARMPAMTTIPATLVIDDRVRRMVTLSIKSTSGVILVGPPGTGKTALLREIVTEMVEDASAFGFSKDIKEPVWVTPDESWTTRELVGGETVDPKGRLRFRPGRVLEAIREDRWLILDETNRADMDKIFGGLLTWLSDQPVVLGRVSTHLESPAVILGWNDAPESIVEGFELLDEEDPHGGAVRFLAGKQWRVLGTYNALDAQRVFRFGQALGRRFARVPIPCPPREVFVQALAQVAETLPEALRTAIAGLYAAHLESESTMLGPALFLRIPTYMRAGIEAGEAGEGGEGEEQARLLAEAYLVNAGTWLAKLEENDTVALGRRIVEGGALPQEEWDWLKSLLPALG